MYNQRELAKLINIDARERGVKLNVKFQSIYHWENSQNKIRNREVIISLANITKIPQKKLAEALFQIN